MDLFNRACFLYSFRCNAVCAHCITDSSPLRKEKMGLKKAQRYIKELAVNNIKEIHFSGGEPFLFYKDICSLIKLTVSLNLKAFVVTNAFWADNLNGSIKILKEIKRCGLKHFGISTDVFHKKFIPLDRVITLAKASKETGMTYSIQMVKAGQYMQIVNSLKKGIGPYAKFFIDLLFFKDKSLEKTGNKKEFLPRTKIKKFGCERSFLIVITPEDRVLSCCAGAIKSRRGSLLEIGSVGETPLNLLIEKARRNLLFKFLSIWGPYGLYEELEMNKVAGLPELHKFNSSCELCVYLLGADKFRGSVIKLFKTSYMKEKIACSEYLYEKKRPTLLIKSVE
ncbi:MAG: hypothetical protein COV73_04865 [Candidatus Omnitrophica bacterium CG11_big_fil_rev_8_21_14_0_20_43_6]|nr:MAG: hypothetical protein COV73_04865 [Candidatus Omnitrophica bacterium CG11_big_fil_rev_8_21_14_0_20_43_6]